MVRYATVTHAIQSRHTISARTTGKRLQHPVPSLTLAAFSVLLIQCCSLMCRATLQLAAQNCFRTVRSLAQYLFPRHQIRVPEWHACATYRHSFAAPFTCQDWTAIHSTAYNAARIVILFAGSFIHGACNARFHSLASYWQSGQIKPLSLPSTGTKIRHI